METLTIKVKDNKTLKLIHDLEALDLIHVVGSTDKNSHTNLSQILKGSLTPGEAEKLQQELKTMRNEWERDTY
jgi:HAMP domain-containing protein